jgi:serine/threonine protein kinase
MDTDGHTPMLEGDDLLAGRYRLIEKVGEGGAAEVFRARDVRLDRIVAIKLLRSQYTHDEASRKRFVVEAKAAAALSHPNIVDIYDFGEADDGAMFLAMQFVEGKNLKDILQKRGRLSPAEAITIAIQACHALTAAHAKGLIHRDVKPQNIMIDERGNAHLTDFGVVKALSGPSLTQSGMTFGTAAYLSPEQATGEQVGPASDIYALGCVMYECLTSRPPFTGDNPAIVAYKQVWEQPHPLHEMAPEVLPSLESVVMRCLSKDPRRRYPNTEALATELESLSVSFNQPTQAMSLGAMASGANGGRWTPTGQRSSAEMSQPVPMPAVPAGGTAARPAAHPPLSIPVPRVTAPPPAPPRVTSRTQQSPLPPQRVPVAVNTAGRRDAGWVLPMALVAVLLLGLGGAGVWLGSTLLGSRNGPPDLATATATQVGAIIPPTDTPKPLVATATTLAIAPPIVLTATETVAPAITETVVVALPTDTPLPPATDTPSPPPPTEAPPPTPEPPTATPEPPPTEEPTPEESTPTTEPEPTPAPEPATVAETSGSVVIDDNAFSGGFTNSNRLYHNVTARWVYGQGTRYNTMTARFNLDKAPKGTARLTLVAVDSEDAAKTSILISINDTAIFRGPNPFPNDFQGGPNGSGNWGTFSWEFDAKTLSKGANALTITNLGPGACINCPSFFMIDSVTISWGK